MHSVKIELAKLILVGTWITYQATGEELRVNNLVFLIWARLKLLFLRKAGCFPL